MELQSQVAEMRLLQKQMEEQMNSKSKEIELLQEKVQAFSEAFDGVDVDIDVPLLLHSSDNLAHSFQVARPHQLRSKGSAMMQITTPLAAQPNLKPEGAEQHQQGLRGQQHDSETKPNITRDSVSEKLLEALQAQIVELKEKLTASESANGVAQAAVEIREREIKRLGLLLEQGRDYGAMNTDHAHEANRKIIDQLNTQVDFLNHQLAEYENREMKLNELQEAFEKAVIETKDATEKVETLAAENTELRKAAARAEQAAEAVQQRLLDLQRDVRDGI